MKHILLLLTLLVTAPMLHAQKAGAASALPVDPDTHMVTFSGVVEVPVATQEQLYARAAVWAAGTLAYHLASSKQLQEATDKTQFTITGEMPARAARGQNVGVVSHSLTIYCKDGRYKYVITNLREESMVPAPGSGGAFENEKPACGGMRMYTKMWNDIKRNAEEDLQSLVAHLNDVMQAKGKSPNDF